MTTTTADFAEWIKKYSPPSLQDLVAKYGNYSNIAKKAWRDYNPRMERRQQLRLLRFK